ncbi:vacuolar protein sorting-associated protein 51 homolog [Ctenocephalides felis]|uniref:vacuolar protein sorting-associated protein 51 homolog n=1 Tax=Ctenocephalides felis TaxID=7515 RepID=UPI000E6E4FE5|nr:vacuolar protein sorting-associated protein 51 homolog [Ctenocephalides felis]
MADKSQSVCDINGSNFNSDLYLKNILKDYSLKQIIDHEADIVKDTQSLHSEMQTLVYENYNKFISATDTIKKMKTDFKKMETEMNLLASNMDSITSFSEQISYTLQDTRQQITKLSGVHSLLRRLQFLFKLPSKLKEKMEEKNYSEAVQDYMQARRVLEQYGKHPSFKGIQEDCDVIIVSLKCQLHSEFEVAHSTVQELATSTELLLQLGEDCEILSKEFLKGCTNRLGEQLVLLQDQTEDKDMLEFVDLGCDGFISDLCFVVTSYMDMFNERTYNQISISDEVENELNNLLKKFINKNMEKYLNLVQDRVDSDTGVADILVMLRGLDRFHRRIQAMTSICKDCNFLSLSTDIIIDAANKQCKHQLKSLELHFNQSVTSIRQTLATNGNSAFKSDSVTLDGSLNDLMSNLVLTTIEKCKVVLKDLMVFLQPELTFNVKSEFRASLCFNGIREGLIVEFLHYITETVRDFCSPNNTSNVPPELLLILCKLCFEFENTGVHTLISLCDEWYDIDAMNYPNLTIDTDICADMHDSAQILINAYVKMQGLSISQMLRKSVETRDWLNTIEPRTVRAVMKRVVEELGRLEKHLSGMFVDGGTTQSSDSSRKTHSFSVSRQHLRSSWSSFGPSQLDSTLVSNIHKLFSERIDMFTSVSFTKVSILTGIIKISLKTLLECIRLRTFSKFGLQQVQVDTHYLQLYLWRFVSDENLIHFLLDEILGSAVHRCLEPVLMEPSIVEIICERS